MSSIVNDPNGFRRLLFFDATGRRRTVRLGKLTSRQAEVIKTKVETIIGDLVAGRPHEDEVSRWLRDLPLSLRLKLQKVALIKDAGSGPNLATLGAFLEEYFSGLTVKASTKTIYGHTRRYLEAFFGTGLSLRSVGPLEAERFRRHLKEEGLSNSTVSRRITIARQMFKRAVKWKLIIENPFADVIAGSQRNKGRMYFVSTEEARRVLDACPDGQWRLLFALSRYGGLRCPSEHLGLRWQDLDWERGRMCVHSPKTEHHAGGDHRIVPMFLELRAYLLEAFEAAEPGATHVITRYRNSNANLRTQLHRIIKKAGLKPWPKTFQNLRSTRQTELSEIYPSHVVCAWMGNSESVANDHYLQVTDDHFDRAAALVAGTLPGDLVAPTSESEIAAQKAAQQPAATSRNPSHGLHPQNENPRNYKQLRGLAKHCDAMQEASMGADGFEPSKA